VQLDHVFIRATPGAPEAEALRAFGLSEGPGNTHPGQGTANRRFFFENGFLELLWVADAAEATSALTRPTMLYERLTSAAASPFGLCYAAAAAPFETWDYQPRYLPPGMRIGIATDTPLTEPMWFVLPARGGAQPAPVQHQAGLRRISAVALTMPPAGPLSPAAHASGIAFTEGAHLLEIAFDDGVQGLRHDFRPLLPLVFRF